MLFVRSTSRSGAGLHTGELEFVDGATRELAVHIGQHVLAEAGAGEVLVSSTVEGPRGSLSPSAACMR